MARGTVFASCRLRTQSCQRLAACTNHGRSGGARTRISIAHRRTTGDREELRVSRSGFPTIRSPANGSCDIWVTAFRKLGYQIGRCQLTGKSVRLLYLGSFPRAHLLALSVCRVALPDCYRVHRVALRLRMSLLFASRSVKSNTTASQPSWELKNLLILRLLRAWRSYHEQKSQTLSS